jgi:hypothetical protein
VAPSRRNPRITVSFSPEEIKYINARSDGDIPAYLKRLALNDSGGDDQVCRQFYELGLTLNEALSELIAAAEGQAPDAFIDQLCVLRDAVRTLQRQAVLDQQISIQEILDKLNDAVNANIEHARQSDQIR